jgi:chaperonin GroES
MEEILMETAQLPQPFGDDLVIVEKEREDVSDSGRLVLPETRFADEGLREGTVVSVGPGTQLPDGSRIPMQVLPGDTVLFRKLAGIEIRYEQGAFLVLSERSVLAIVGESQYDESTH